MSLPISVWLLIVLLAGRVTFATRLLNFPYFFIYFSSSNYSNMKVYFVFVFLFYGNIPAYLLQQMFQIFLGCVNSTSLGDWCVDLSKTIHNTHLLTPHITWHSRMSSLCVMSWRQHLSLSDVSDNVTDTPNLPTHT